MIFSKLGVLHKSIMLIFYFCEFSTIECDNINVKLCILEELLTFIKITINKNEFENHRNERNCSIILF